MKNNFDKFNNGEHSKKQLYELLSTFHEAFEESLICSITDARGNIIYANKKFNEISQYPDYEFIGQTYKFLDSGHHPKKFFRKMWETVGKGNIWHREVKNQAKDGSHYWVDTVMFPLKDKSGEITQFLTIQTLITEEKEAEEKRAEEKRIKYLTCLEEILFMSSHRVRKPISTFLGLMQLIDKDKLLNEREQKEILGYAKTTALELDTFTKELTTFICQVIEMYEEKNYDK